jgi:uncharacterized delta-60 repeat protein
MYLFARMLREFCQLLIFASFSVAVVACRVPSSQVSGQDGSSTPTASPSPNENPSSSQGFGSGNSIAVPFGQGADIASPTIALQSDGKFLYVGGTSRGGNYNNASELEIARYNPDGTLDLTFGSNGTSIVEYGTNSYLIGVAVQPDQKIVASGYSFGKEEAILIRFNSDGTVDSSFAIVNKPLAGFIFPTIQANGKILVSALYSGIFRFNSDGTPDQSFGIAGKAEVPQSQCSGSGCVHWAGVFGAAFALQKDQKIVACGYTPFYQSSEWSNDFATLIRLNPDGSRDNSFGVSGIVPPPIFGASPCSAVVIQPDGKILIAGSMWYPNICDPNTSIRCAFYIARFNSDGSLDSSFATNGKYFSKDLSQYSDVNNLTTLSILPDGRIFGAGRTGTILLDSAGRPDSSYVNPVIKNGTAGSTISSDGTIFLYLNREVYRIKP